MALEDDIIVRLSSQSVGSTSASSTGGWHLVAPQLYSTQDRSIAVQQTGGFQQEASVDQDRPTFQVLVRGRPTDWSTLNTKVTDVVTALNLWSATVNGYRYVDVQKQGDRARLGRDQNDRPMVSVNFLALRARST